MSRVNYIDEHEARLLERLISPEDAHRVLWHYADDRKGLIEPGAFYKALTEAAVRADRTNRHRLATGFPGLVAALRLADVREDGLTRLRRLAGLDQDGGGG